MYLCYITRRSDNPVFPPQGMTEKRFVGTKTQDKDHKSKLLLCFFLLDRETDMIRDLGAHSRVQ